MWVKALFLQLGFERRLSRYLSNIKVIDLLDSKVYIP
jgi:hypothetical protein